MTATLKKSGFRHVNCVAVSGWYGFNLTRPDLAETFKWQQPDLIADANTTLLDALRALRTPRRPPAQKLLRMAAEDVYKISGVGTVVCGRVETGGIRVGDKISVVPKGWLGGQREVKHTQVTGLEYDRNAEE